MKRLLPIIVAFAILAGAILVAVPECLGSSGLDLFYCPKCGGHHSSGHPHFRGPVITPPPPPPPKPTPRQLAVPVYNQAVDYCNARNWTRAIECLQKALEIDPSYTLARDLLTKVQDLYNRELANAAYNRAVDHFNSGRWSQAIDELGRALRYNPNDPQARDLLRRAKEKKAEQDSFDTAMGYYRKNDMQNAMKYLRQAMKHNPDNSTYKKYLDDAQRQITSSLLADLIRELRENRDTGTLSFRDLGAGKSQRSNTLSFNQLPSVRSGELTFANLDRPPVRSIEILPPIREKQYIRIDPGQWPAELKPHIELTNERLAQIHKAADEAGQAAVDWLKSKAYSIYAAKIPGYQMYSTIKGQVEELHEMFIGDRVDLAQRNLDFCRRSADTIMGIGGQSASYQEVEQMLEGRKRKYDGFVRKKIRSDVEERWKKDTTPQSDDEPSRIRPIEKVPEHPDLHRWNYHKWFLQANLLKQQ